MNIEYVKKQHISQEKYDAESIQVLKGLDAVKKRPGMYIGDVSSTQALHHMVYEVLDNSIDEALGGYCDTVTICLNKDGSATVRDNGRGIPVEIHKEEGISGVELIMTQLHAGGKFDNNTYKVSGGLHGVGVSVVNALSDWLEVKIWRNKKEYFMRFEDGQKASELTEIASSNPSFTGTEITFLPSNKTFTITEFNFADLEYRIRELAFLNPNLKIKLIDDRVDVPKEVDFCFSGGMIEFLHFLDRSKKALHTPIIIDVKSDEIEIKVALEWNDSYSENTLCFTNNIRQKDGGTHLSGFRSAITKTISSYAQNFINQKNKVTLEAEDIREGMTCILSIKMPDPKFSSQTKDKLVSGEIRAIVENTVTTAMHKWLEENPYHAKMIVSRIVESSLAREAARKARELSRKKSSIEIATLPGKLANCQEKNPAFCELFIVEGESAGGPAKQGRDRKTQAILPIKGKILNVERTRMDRVLGSAEIGTMISALNTGIGKEDFNIAKLRYHKVIIMTDADVDGAHIRTLLLTFFFRYMPQLIENKHLYIAQPPLYKAKKGQRDIYFQNPKELQKFLINSVLEDCMIQTPTTLYQAEDLKIILDKISCFCELVEEMPKTKWNLNEIISLLIIKNRIVDFHDIQNQKSIQEEVIKSLKAKNDDQREEISFISEITEDGMMEITSTTRGVTDKEFVSPIRICNRLKRVNIDEFSEIAELFINNQYMVSLKIKSDTYQCNVPTQVLNKIIDVAKRGVYIQRFKGLGEMNADQLWDTTMDPEKRILLQVNITNLNASEEVFSTLMGDVVEARREFIQNNALNVKTLDA